MRKLNFPLKVQNDNGSKMLLCSSFHVDATLETNLAAVKRRLAMLPHISVIREGSKIACNIKGLKNSAEIAFEKAHIEYRFYFEKPDLHIYIDNLLAFMAMLGLLRNDYDVKLSCMHSYIAYALSESTGAIYSNREARMDNLADQVTALNRINVSLARELVSCHALNMQVSKENGIFKKFAHEVLGAAASHGATNLLKSIGVDETTVKNAEHMLGAKGEQ
ncbi:MAG: hypothetical protein M1360_03800 [Candidatus Marsarchaeota archaeon]|jgi:hypothetical protein|nr:hypothetical protein [Candidatus Marsarchaeota archaeon]MCL5419036.1 hypothetical protein [Candidatus Marsarchaeota archaeon]